MLNENLFREGSEVKLPFLTGHRSSRSSAAIPQIWKRAASALVVTIAFSSCGKAGSGPQAASTGGTETTSSSAIVSLLAGTNGHAKYSWIKANILDPKCMDCHSAHQGDGDGLEKANFDSYEGVLKTVTPKLPETSDLYVMVKTKKMPKGMDAMPGMPAKPGVPLSASELRAISDWITSGAPNN